ncbi:class I SAM-dependent methyltransferase [Paenibacillus xylanexedens]|uniref:class I SAM-dependent methyltransferase n=1 Tax=Paenibacillus xylanexedens TaxID=528191 RepID=UPI0011A93BD6|nr:class I SAM-dependent methyltransferase [Paenibacillus xylanexedens]
MVTLVHFQTCLREYAMKFNELGSKYDHTLHHSSELEALIDHYSRFVTDPENKAAWEQLAEQELDSLHPLVEELRQQSAYCVAIMEKYRALRLQRGDVQIADYFKNIEECIDKEFGSFHVTSQSKVLLVGSGSFPMTPLYIAKRTGAEVVGIDTDEEAITLGQKVVEILGAGLNIRLERILLEQLDYTREATHIIFSSTVANKYDLLDPLHDLTNDHVVVAMRYGDQLKSLFNYPMRETDSQKWKLADTVLRPDDVFDIALYQKA